MNSERIKEIQEKTAYPESQSIALALKRVWNECEQDNKGWCCDCIYDEIMNSEYPCNQCYHNYINMFKKKK